MKLLALTILLTLAADADRMPGSRVEEVQVPAAVVAQQ